MWLCAVKKLCQCHSHVHSYLNIYTGESCNHSDIMSVKLPEGARQFPSLQTAKQAYQGRSPPQGLERGCLATTMTYRYLHSKLKEASGYFPQETTRGEN